MFKFLAVFLGGGIGSVLRYMIDILYIRYGSMTFPFATFAVNLVACFLMGCCMAYFLATHTNGFYKCLFVVGFCGGFSTMSALSFEVFEMLKSGEILPAVLYIFLSFVVCVCMTALGFYWTKCYV